MPSKKESSQEKKVSFLIDFLPEVDSDTEEAFDWYELQKPGLGDEFFSAVEECLSRIQTNPLSFQKICKQTRRALTRKFPFGIFFILNDNVITVTAIVHLARHPKTWKRR